MVTLWYCVCVCVCALPKNQYVALCTIWTSILCIQQNTQHGHAEHRHTLSERAGTFHDSTFQPTVILWFVIVIWLSFRIRCICSSITIFYMRCLNADRPLCFRPENIYGCFFASSSIDVELSWVECGHECIYGQWSFRSVFSLCITLPTAIFDGYTL